MFPEDRPAPPAARETASLLRSQRPLAQASATRREGDGQLASLAALLRVTEARGPQARRPVKHRGTGREAARRGSAGRSVTSRWVWRKNPPGRPRGPSAQGQLAGAASGGDSGPRARHCPRGNVPSPTPASLTPPTSPPRRVRPPPSLQALGAASASAGPPRTAPPDGLCVPTPRPGSRPEGPGPPRPATPSAGRPRGLSSEGQLRPRPARRPTGLPWLLGPGPAAPSKLEPGWGGAPGITPSRGSGVRLDWTCPARRLGWGGGGGRALEAPARCTGPAGRGAPASRPGGRADPPLGPRAGSS